MAQNQENRKKKMYVEKSVLQIMHNVMILTRIGVQVARRRSIRESRECEQRDKGTERKVMITGG